MGRAAVGGTELALEGTHRQSAGLGEVAIGDGFAEILADETDRGAEGGVGRGAGFLFVEWTRDAGGADDPAFGVMDGDFGSDAPAGGVVEAADEFDARDDALAGEDALVVHTVLVGEGETAEIVVGAADDLGAGLKAEVKVKRYVDPLIVAGLVFHPEQRIGDKVEQLDDLGRHRADAGEGGKRVRVAVHRGKTP